MSHHHVACPLCGADDAAPRYRLEVGSLVTCRGCGLTYVTPRIDAAEMERRLQSWAVQDTVDETRLAIAFEPATMALYARHVAAMTRAANGGAGGAGRMLDVGCATGAFLLAGRDAGWAVEGLELGEASAAYAREALGIPVTLGSLYGAEPVAAPYDAAVLLEVIEHLPAPLDALRRLHGWLRPGGVLLLSTPNFDSLYRRLAGTRWWVVNCEEEHIVLFTPQTIAAALEQAGFEVVSLGTRSLDHGGILRAALGRHGDPRAATGAGYYEARGRKGRLKAWLGRLGVLGLARAALRLQDRLLSWRGSPVYGLGEQLVVLARRRAS